MEALELAFRGVMSFGVIVGFATAYPLNVWMVRVGVKQGLMTQRPERNARAEGKVSTVEANRSTGNIAADTE